MAMVKCKDCERNVSDKAEKCPFCGCPINYEFTDEELKAKEEKKRKANKIWLIFMIVCAVIIAVCIPIIASDNNDDYSATTNQEAYRALIRAQNDMGSGFKESEINFEIVYSDGSKTVILCEAISDNAKSFYNTYYDTTIIYYGHENGYGTGEYSYALSDSLEGAKTKMGWYD